MQSTAGPMKSSAASPSPAQPARRLPRSRASWVDAGPGTRLQAAKSSPNSSAPSQRRRRTTSRSISATWLAGPPKATQPSRPKTAATSPSRARRVASTAG